MKVNKNNQKKGIGYRLLSSADYFQLAIHGIVLFKDRWVYLKEHNLKLEVFADIVEWKEVNINNLEVTQSIEAISIIEKIQEPEVIINITEKTKEKIKEVQNNLIKVLDKIPDIRSEKEEVGIDDMKERKVIEDNEKGIQNKEDIDKNTVLDLSSIKETKSPEVKKKNKKGV